MAYLTFDEIYMDELYSQLSENAEGMVWFKYMQGPTDSIQATWRVN